MTIQFLFSLLMLLFFTYCYFYIGATMPVSPSTELGGEQWPQIILGLLMVLLMIHLFHLWKEQRQAGAGDKISLAVLRDMVRGKLLVSFLLVVAMAVMMEYAGFLLTSFCFVAAYCFLLGERRAHIIFAASLAITVILYFVFSKGLSIMLPRGYGVLRSFALWIEAF